jgi:hypothetical protein
MAEQKRQTSNMFCPEFSGHSPAAREALLRRRATIGHKEERRSDLYSSALTN